MRIGSAKEYVVETTPCSLGKGAFGVVVKGRHRATGRTVAIKSLRSPADDPDELRREAHLLVDASRGNPYVVAFHGLVRDRATGAYRLAMEYAGPSLRVFLRDRSSDRQHTSILPEATVRAFMWQLLTGAMTMHARGIVHRDIKPANVLVGDTGIKLCDLGLAMYLTSEPTPYKKAGTPCYKAPEVLMGKPDYDARVDTWSLGCVMAEMLTGEKIFDGADDNDIDQLWTIFGVLGLPDDATWPGFSALPLANVTMRWLYERKKRSRLGELFNDQRLSQDGFEVLEGLLACNPDRRLTAAAALELPWFASFGAAAAAAELVALALPGENTIPAQTTPKKKNMLRLKVPLEIWNALRTATRSKTHGSGTYKRLSNL